MRELNKRGWTSKNDSFLVFLNTVAPKKTLVQDVPGNMENIPVKDCSTLDLFLMLSPYAIIWTFCHGARWIFDLPDYGNSSTYIGARKEDGLYLEDNARSTQSEN